MSFKTLNNEEWVFIHLYLSDIQDYYNNIIKKGGIEHQIQGPFGDFKVFQNFDKSDINKILDSEKYRYINNIIKKIDPIFDIVEDSTPSLVKKIHDSVFEDTESLFDFNNNDDEDEIL